MIGALKRFLCKKDTWLLLIVLSVGTVNNYTFAVVDSIGVNNVNGERIIIHKLKPQETYYALSRIYDVPVKNIIQANQNKPLKIGDTARIPTGKPYVDAVSNIRNADVTDNVPLPLPDIGEFTEYKVGRGETLYNISKRFQIAVEDIKRANNLTDNTIKEGLLLRVPHAPLAAPAVAVAPREIGVNQGMGSVMDSADIESVVELPTNRYGLREVNERGLGVWMDDLVQESGSMLALHKTAPVGTVIKVTNPMTGKAIFAKVVGKFTDTSETQNAIIVISKSAASLIGVLDRRFQIEINYGAPLDI